MSSKTLSDCCTSLKLTKNSSSYSLYVLGLLVFAYLLNQLDRYTLAIVTKPLAQELHYGDKACMINESFSLEKYSLCAGIASENECVQKNDFEGAAVCKWDYTGFGLDYQILAGPIFILVYTFAGIPLSFAADSYNRKVLLGVSVFFWSLCTLLTGFVNNYWELAVLRFGLGLGQSGCSPFSTSLITDYFTADLRGAALGVHNWGIYTGYSLSYAIGNIITEANINDQGWRWAFIIAGLPGVILGVLIILTVREPERKNTKSNEVKELNTSATARLRTVAKSFCRPSILLLCIAGSIRNAAGYVWAYNTQAYFEGIGETRTQIAYYLSWVPMLAGSIGVVLGGFISDRVVTTSGPHGRIWVLIASQLLAAPFAAAILWLPTPWAYLGIIPCNIIGEMWVSVTLAVLVELVPQEVKTTAVAVYFFIISNVGGNMPLVVPLIRNFFENYGYPPMSALRHALLILFPGEYVIGSILFLLALIFLSRDIKYIRSCNASP